MRVLGCTVLVAFSAAGASQTQKNRCSDAARELRTGPTFTYDKKGVPASEVRNAAAHLKDVVQRFEHAKKLLDATGDWSSKDPDLTDCVVQFNRYIAYFEATKAKLAAASETAKAQAPVAEAAAGHDTQHAVAVLAAVQLKPSADVFTNLKPAAAKALYDSLDPVAKACRETHPDGLRTPPAMPPHSPSVTRIAAVEMPSTLSSSPDWQCFVALNREDLAKRAIGNVRTTAQGYGNHSIIFAEILKAGPRWQGHEANWLFDIASDEKPFVAKLKTSLAAWYQAFGFSVPDGPLTGLDEQIREVRSAVAAAAERNVVTMGADHDRSIENGAKDLVRDFYPKLAVAASWMDAPGWTVEQNALGIPVSRFRSGQIVYRVGNDPWCRQRTFNWVEAHMGGGKYNAPSRPTILEGVKVVKCP